MHDNAQIAALIDFHKGRRHAAEKQLKWYTRELNDPSIYKSNNTVKKYRQQIARFKKQSGRYGDTVELLSMIMALQQERDAYTTSIPLAMWSEDDGAVLWWRFPIEEPPYCGSPLDTDWPGYHTHWTRLVMPEKSDNTDKEADNA